MRSRAVSPSASPVRAFVTCAARGSVDVHLVADDPALLGVLVDGDAVAAEGRLDVELAAQQGDDLVPAEAVARDADLRRRAGRRGR